MLCFFLFFSIRTVLLAVLLINGSVKMFFPLVHGYTCSQGFCAEKMYLKWNSLFLERAPHFKLLFAFTQITTRSAILYCWWAAELINRKLEKVVESYILQFSSARRSTLIIHLLFIQWAQQVALMNMIFIRKIQTKLWSDHHQTSNSRRAHHSSYQQKAKSYKSQKKSANWNGSSNILAQQPQTKLKLVKICFIFHFPIVSFFRCISRGLSKKGYFFTMASQRTNSFGCQKPCYYYSNEFSTNADDRFMKYV